MNAFWIILTGSLVATCCGLLGCYLILRKMAMVGDAISHAVLPGIVLAYMIAGSRDSFFMLVGAAALGIFTTFMIELLSRRGRVQNDASIGITFTWLFAIGIILITKYTANVDLDQECVLYGEIEYVPLDTAIFGIETAVPHTVWVLSAMLLAIIAFIGIGYKGLNITTFNPEYAAALGISTAFWHYAVMSAVSLTTVLSFDSVGAILVVAFLIVPAATAYILTENLPYMLGITVVVGILSSVGGYFIASVINGSTAGAMAVMAGILFLLAFIYKQVITRKQQRNVLAYTPSNTTEGVLNTE